MKKLRNNPTDFPFLPKSVSKLFKALYIDRYLDIKWSAEKFSDTLRQVEVQENKEIHKLKVEALARTIEQSAEIKAVLENRRFTESETLEILPNLLGAVPENEPVARVEERIDRLNEKELEIGEDSGYIIVESTKNKIIVEEGTLKVQENRESDVIQLEHDSLQSKIPIKIELAAEHLLSEPNLPIFESEKIPINRFVESDSLVYSEPVPLSDQMQIEVKKQNPIEEMSGLTIYKTVEIPPVKFSDSGSLTVQPIILPLTDSDTLSRPKPFIGEIKYSAKIDPKERIFQAAETIFFIPEKVVKETSNDLNKATDEDQIVQVVSEHSLQTIADLRKVIETLQGEIEINKAELKVKQNRYDKLSLNSSKVNTENKELELKVKKLLDELGEKDQNIKEKMLEKQNISLKNQIQSLIEDQRKRISIDKYDINDLKNILEKLQLEVEDYVPILSYILDKYN
jgi:hypothetical protein